MKETEMVYNYIKTKYPEMLTTLDFVMYRTKVSMQEAVGRILNETSMTHADAIRDMDDEDLAKFLTHRVHEDFEEPAKVIGDKYLHDEDEVLEWLRSKTWEV